jgi:predicted dinucleotide-binding enzyme
MPSFRITILGAGPIGSTLGSKWAKAGHSVAFGVQDPTSERAQRLREELGESVFIGSAAESLEQGDIALLATPGHTIEELVRTHAHRLDHKLIIDATNQLTKGKTAAEGKWSVQGPLNSLATLQTYAPHAQVYRAFNSYAWEAFDDPIYQGVQADLFYCGPQADTQTIIEQLIDEIGLHPVWLGDLDQIEVVDNILRLWATLALFQDKGRNNIAFKVLHR